MRSANIMAFAFTLILAASAAFTQQCSMPAQQGAGPAAGLTPAERAGVGAGPAPCLQNFAGPDFDRAYIQLMYQLHTTITALATQGIQQAGNGQLRDLSGKIRYEQTKQSEKLSLFYKNLGYGAMPACYAGSQNTLNNLIGLRGRLFDLQYAKTMAALLQQQMEAAALGLCRITNQEVRHQAEMVANSSQVEVLALQRWVSINASPTVVPAEGTH